MSPEATKAVSEYFNRGGQVEKLAPPIAITLEELLAYLAACGIRMSYLEGDVKPYFGRGRRHGVAALVRLANTHRQSQQLAPFVIRAEIRPARARLPRLVSPHSTVLTEPRLHVLAYPVMRDD